MEEVAKSLGPTAYKCVNPALHRFRALLDGLCTNGHLAEPQWSAGSVKCLACSRFVSMSKISAWAPCAARTDAMGVPMMAAWKEKLGTFISLLEQLSSLTRVPRPQPSGGDWATLLGAQLDDVDGLDVGGLLGFFHFPGARKRGPRIILANALMSHAWHHSSLHKPMFAGIQDCSLGCMYCHCRPPPNSGLVTWLAKTCRNDRATSGGGVVHDACVALVDRALSSLARAKTLCNA